jgi:hypothetical protein
MYDVDNQTCTEQVKQHTTAPGNTGSRRLLIRWFGVRDPGGAPSLERGELIPFGWSNVSSVGEEHGQ